MPPINQKALDALNSLASGGSAGYDAYKQAQAKEQASRTTALQGALGNNDVYNAATRAQAQYAPNVGGTGFQDAGSLLPAANQYLSEAANRISSENYVNHLKETAANRGKELLGAAEVYGQQQRAQLGDKLESIYGSNPLQQAIAQRQKLEAQQAAFGGREGLAQLAFAQPGDAAAQEKIAQAQALTADMAANEAALRQAYGQYAGAAGTDTAGFEAALKSGNITGGEGSGSVADLANFLSPQVQQNRAAAQAEGQRAIDMGGQARLRELAPLFGMSQLEAEGTFREGEGNDLARVVASGKMGEYVAGLPDQEAKASALGFATPSAYNAIRNQTKMSDQDMVETFNSPAWSTLNDVAQQYRIGAGTNQAAGEAGFKQEIRERLFSGENAELLKPNSELNDEQKKRKQELTNVADLAIGYFSPGIFKAVGSDKNELE